MRTLYLITYSAIEPDLEDDLKVLVWANSPDEAEVLAHAHMQDRTASISDEDCTYWNEDTWGVCDNYYVHGVEEFDKNHELWQDFVDYEEDYPMIGAYSVS